MNAKLSAWLKKAIRSPLGQAQKRPSPPPWVRKMLRVSRWFACVAFICFAIWRVMLYHEINGRLSAIQSAGLPTSGEELNSWRGQVLDSENGALVLTQAFALVRTFPDSRSITAIAPGLLEHTNQWSAEIHEMVAEYVRTNDAVVAKIREAERLPHFRFKADFAYGPETELPHLSDLKVLARIIALRAALAAEEGRMDEWSDQTVSLLNLGTTLDEEPTIISHLVQSAIVQMAVKTAERGLNRGEPVRDKAGKLCAAFVEIEKTNLLARCLIGERALTIPVFRLSWSEIQNLSRSDDTEKQPRKPHRLSGKPAFLPWLSGFFERDLNFYLQTMDKSVSLARLSGTSPA